MEIILTILELMAGLVLFYLAFAACAWLVLAMANLYFYIRSFGEKRRTKNQNVEPITSAQLRAYELLTNNPKVFDVYNKLTKHPYIEEPHPAAKSNNEYRSLLQQQLRVLVPDKIVRVTIYDMANKKE